MKWLDEKGRIGGVINLFDLLVLVVAVFLIRYYWFQTPELVPSSAPKTAAVGSEAKAQEKPEREPAILEDIQFVFRDLDPAVAARIRAGDKDSTHPDTTAEIVQVLVNERAANVIKLGNQQILARVPGDKRQVRVRMKIRGPIENETFFYKDQPLQSGKSYTFVTPKYILVGEALRLDDSLVKSYMPVKRWLRIRAQALKIDRYTVEMLREGDRAMPPKDIAPDMLRLEIKRVLRIDPSRIKTWNLQGEARVEVSAEKRDMELILECLCAHNERGYHFGSLFIRAGGDGYFQTPLYQLPLIFRKVEVLPADYKPEVSS
ncbi:MAG: DUF4330 family protein [Nitrospinota bacterium]